MEEKQYKLNQKIIMNVKNFLENEKNKFQNYIQENKVYFKYFLIIFIIYIIALIPIFRANFNYIDDLGRKLSGYRNFGFSRNTSNFLSMIVNTSEYLTDISPFTQILAVVILSLTSVILIKLLTKSKEKVNFWYILAVIPIGLSPYFLENLSYKFDSPYMALSIFASVFPLLFYNKDKKYNIAFCIINAICAIIMCTTYQPSSGILLSVTIAMCLLMINEKESWKNIFKFLILSVFSFGVGLLLFKFCIMEPVQAYVDNSNFPLKEIIPGSIGNYKHFFRLISEDFKKGWLIAIAIISVSFIITNAIKSKRNKAVSIIFSVLALVALILLSFGLYPFIKQPLFAPRSMYGIGIAIAITSLIAVDYKRAYVPRVFSLYLTYSFVILTLTYGNALAEQKRYTEFRIGLVASDLNDINVNSDEEVLVNVEGSIGKPNDVKNLINNNKVIGKLIPETFGSDTWYWASAYFYNYFNLPNMSHDSQEMNKDSMECYKTTRYHDIYLDGNKVLIVLKDV